ncbi:MAG: NAD(P)H-quinone oxidoreductase subunit J, chloroplastic [Phycisphaerae bacterium]|nr:NAD(P)H-quinone oxidoreductase subunit J, chloroplastic [Phycisphaerae bacterium]
MTPEQISRRLQDRFADAVRAADASGLHPHAVVEPGRWVEVARFLRDDADLAMDFLRSISGVDYPEDGKLVSVYDLISTRHGHAFAIKVEAPRDNPHTPSVCDVWPAADWHEREAFDLLGIVYDGHPRLTRILLPDDWAGYPLRKDYEFPREYHGIPCSTETNQERPLH